MYDVKNRCDLLTSPLISPSWTLGTPVVPVRVVFKTL